MAYQETIDCEGGYRIRVIVDSDAQSPEEGDEMLVYLVHFHRQFEFCSKGLPFSTKGGFIAFAFEGPEAPTREDYEDDPEGYEEAHTAWKAEYAEWNALRNEYAIFPVDSYIHGGVALALSGSDAAARMPDRQWDVSRCGAVLVRKDGEWGEDTPEFYRKIAEAHVETWNQYLSGDVWGFVVEQAETCGTCSHTEWVELDSCWGFYGQKAAIEEAKSRVEYYREREAAASVNGPEA